MENIMLLFCLRICPLAPQVTLDDCHADKGIKAGKRTTKVFLVV
jgi:hypothetical protein